MTSHADAMGAEQDTCPIMPNYGPPPVMFVQGKGTELWDRDGKRYLDFLCGLAVNSLGHSHPVIADAVCEQARKLQHVSNLFGTEPQLHVARMLDELLGGGGKVLFQNSGAEANEGALKLARRFQGRGREGVLSAFRSFHGRTLMTLAATGQPEKHEVFQPLPEGFRYAAWNDLGEFEKALDDTVGTVIIEPIQGEGGVHAAEVDFFAGLRTLCDTRGVTLILDEIQTGLGRTGEWFGFQHYGIEPDIVTMAKALGNGMPIGAVWARTEVADAFRAGDHGSTFGGQPLATSAAKAVLEIMCEMDAPAVATRRGAELTEALLAHDGIESIRGKGMLLGVELTADALAGRTGPEVARACLDAGLIVNGITPTALRLAPPLTISTAEISEGVAILASVLGAK